MCDVSKHFIFLFVSILGFCSQPIQLFISISTLGLLLRTTERQTEGIIRQLQGIGVGIRFGVIDILQCATLPLLQAPPRKGREYRLGDRQSLALIHEQVDGANHLTFNFICFVIIAAIIAAVGLATNSPATVVASMLVSPLMGPIMGLTLGTSMRDWELVRKGLRNEAVGSGLTLLVGVLWGVSVAWFPEFWDQNEQITRGTASGLYMGLVVAIPR